MIKLNSKMNKTKKRRFRRNKNSLRVLGGSLGAEAIVLPA
jgi:hypothetical protein